jgi:trehalase-like protein
LSRIAAVLNPEKFLSMVQQEFVRYGTIEEKYDVVRRRSDVSKSLRFGYRTNEAGFGWTNAVFTSLFDELPASDQHKLLKYSLNFAEDLEREALSLKRDALANLEPS